MIIMINSIKFRVALQVLPFNVNEDAFDNTGQENIFKNKMAEQSQV